MDIQTGIKRDGSPAYRTYDIAFISEPSLYYVIFNSRKPNAIAFQNWVYTEVLPRMRQLGRNESIESLQNKINELELKAETLEASRESLINLIIEGGIL
jgi:prophage antirepressor-like protein